MIYTAIARDLAGWPLTATDKGYRLQLNEQLQVKIEVHSKRLFMASVLSSRFSCYGSFNQTQTDVCRIQVHQPGWLRRKPVEFRSRQSKGQAVAAHLNLFDNLRKTLGELDYRRIELTLDHQGWRCTIEPWAASEVVCRMPPIRRYLRLEKYQRMVLLSSLNMVSEAMQMMDVGTSSK